MLLNRSLLNGAALNGQALSRVVAADVSMSCPASVTAAAQRQVLPQTSASVITTFSADAQRIQTGTSALSALASVSAQPLATLYAAASLDGYAEVYTSARTITSAGAEMPATATMLSYVLRDVQAESLMSCAASLSAFVGLSAESAISAFAAMQAAGIKVQSASGDAYVSATLSASGVANRRVESSIQADATARIETTVNKKQEAFAYVVATATTDSEPVVRRFDGVTFEAGCTMAAAATHNQRTDSLMVAECSVETAASLVFAVKSSMQGEADVEVEAIRAAGAYAQASGAATFTALPTTDMAVGCEMQAVGLLSTLGTLTKFGDAPIHVAASLAAGIIVHVMPETSMAAAATMSCDVIAGVQREASTDVVLQCNAVASALQMHATSNAMAAKADLLAYPFSYTINKAASGMLCEASIAANATVSRLIRGYVLAEAGAGLYAEALALGSKEPDASRVWAMARQPRGWVLPRQNRTFEVSA